MKTPIGEICKKRFVSVFPTFISPIRSLIFKVVDYLDLN